MRSIGWLEWQFLRLKIRLMCRLGKHDFDGLISSVLGRDCINCDYHEPYVPNHHLTGERR